MIEVLESGPLTTVQDLGRPGLAALGVPRSGGFDRGSLRLANRLVGNREDAATLEVTLGGLVIRLGAAATVALTGAPCPGLDWGRPVSLAAGSVVRLAAAPSGMRAYLAVRGGIDATAELGSRSSDLFSDIGPRRLRAGDRLPVGHEFDGPVPAGEAPHPALRAGVRIVAGPRDEWFAADALVQLTGTAWTVRPESDRTGLRLDGPALLRADRYAGVELPSEPTRPGALQIPPDGRPILFGPDAPVTGGYPVIAVALTDDLDVVAQLRPGEQVRFVAVRTS